VAELSWPRTVLTESSSLGMFLLAAQRWFGGTVLVSLGIVTALSSARDRRVRRAPPPP
jgi:hypothetical protein